MSRTAFFCLSPTSQATRSLAKFAFTLLGLLALANGSVTAADPIPHQVVRVSPIEAQSAVEVSIAINPTDRNNLVAGAIMRGYPQSREPNYTFVSSDGGVSWETQPSSNPDQRTQGDDVVVASSGGLFVHGYICFTGLWGDHPQRCANGIFISTSDDQGNTWQAPVMVVDHLNSRTPMEDKPWFAFDRWPSSPHHNWLYCSWTRFDVYGSEDPQDTTQIMFARSRDRGRSFDPVIRISDQGGSCVDGDDAVEGATPCISPDGTISVVWAGPRGMELDQSHDGGKTWGKDRVIAEIVGGWDYKIDGIGRANGMPVTAIDTSQSDFRGSLYVNWSDVRNGDTDVFLMHSRDDGKSWSAPIRVNNDAVGNGRDQFFTWMAVDPADGSINVAFYDRRDTVGTGTGLTLARSIDGGQTFKNFKIDQPAFECNPSSFFGDYIGIDAQQGRVAVAYMHFEGKRKLGVSAALFDFEPGSLESAK